MSATSDHNPLAGYPKVAAFLDQYDDGPGSVGPEPVSDLLGVFERLHVTDHPFVIGTTIDDFLPSDLYLTILRAWSDLPKLAPVRLPGSGYVGSRESLCLQDWVPKSDAGPPEDAWNHLCRALRSPAFVRPLFTRFASTVEVNLQDPKNADLCRPGFKLWASLDAGADEALGAHIDALHKLLTIVLYVDLQGPVDADSKRLWGTALYDAEPGAFAPVNFTANADHDPVDYVEFRPNRAFVMPNASHALHGVAGGQPGVARRTLMWGYWFFDAKH